MRCGAGLRERGSSLAAAVAVSAIGLAATTPAGAADRYALIVCGASGGQKYAATYAGWRDELVSTLVARLHFESDHIVLLGGAEEEGGEAGKRGSATREGIRAALGGLARRIAPDDLLLVVLIGHGTFDGTLAKFNLVGPDLDAREWNGLLRGVPGRLVFVNTSSASFPFVEKLASKGRVVITATDSPLQRYDTVFAGFFVKALADAASDLDKDRRVSVWEVFASASAAAQKWYEQKGQLPTERALIDDAGEGVGIEATNATANSPARTIFLDPDPAADGPDAETSALRRRQQELLGQVSTLKGRKGRMSSEEYEAELETLLVELARVSRQLRVKS
jgi:hypothetical protein